jgi:DNA topoisomerase VI subunit A
MSIFAQIFIAGDDDNEKNNAENWLGAQATGSVHRSTRRLLRKIHANAKQRFPIPT